MSDPGPLKPLSEEEARHVLENEQVILAAMAGRHPGLVIPACVGMAAELAVDILPAELVDGMVEELCRLLRARARARLELRRAELGSAAGNA